MSFVKSVDGSGGVKFKLVAGSDQAEEFTVEFVSGVTAAIGRGTTDTDVVYLKLKNADGEDAYIYPDAAQTAIVVQATRP